MAWEVAQSEIKKSQQHQKKQYDKGPSQWYMRKMVFMPQETTSEKRKLALPYYGPYDVLEVR